MLSPFRRRTLATLVRINREAPYPADITCSGWPPYTKNLRPEEDFSRTPRNTCEDIPNALRTISREKTRSEKIMFFPRQLLFLKLTDSRVALRPCPACECPSRTPHGAVVLPRRIRCHTKFQFVIRVDSCFFSFKFNTSWVETSQPQNCHFLVFVSRGSAVFSDPLTAERDTFLTAIAFR